jgi:hypothetical protein
LEGYLYILYSSILFIAAYYLVYGVLVTTARITAGVDDFVITSCKLSLHFVLSCEKSISVINPCV